MCCHVDICTWESDNKVAAFVCVLRFGSWAICCIATGFVAKSTVHILLTTVLTCTKTYMVAQVGYVLELDHATERFFIVDLPEGVEFDQYPGSLVHCRRMDYPRPVFSPRSGALPSARNHRHGRARGRAGGGAHIPLPFLSPRFILILSPAHLPDSSPHSPSLSLSASRISAAGSEARAHGKAQVRPPAPCVPVIC